MIANWEQIQGKVRIGLLALGATLCSSAAPAGELSAIEPIDLDSPKGGGLVIPEEEESIWRRFSIEGTYVYQNQNYAVSDLEADFEIPEIRVPEIKITNADVDHLIPRELPPFIRAPLVAQARATAQKEAERIAEEEVAKARAMIPTVDASSVKSIENTVHTATMRLGFSPARFLNIFAVGGRVDGEVDVSLVDPFGDLTVGYEGWVYGAGGTVMVGTDRVFASFTGVYTIADLSEGDSQIETWVLTPKIGVHGERGALWVGMHHQSTAHTQSGTFEFDPLGPVDYDITLADETNWNYLVGGRLNIGERCYVILEGGFGDRTQALVSVGMEF